MNYPNMGILGITLFTVIVGVILGLVRGWKRSAVRLVLIAAAAVAALRVQHPATTAILSVKVSGKPLQAYLQPKFPEEFGSANDLMLSMTEIVMGILVFILLFLAFQFLTWLIFCLLKLILRPRPGEKTGRLPGMLIGAMTGCAVAFLICVPLNGLYLEAAKFEQVKINGEALMKDLPDAVSFIGYSKSTASRIYTPLGGGFYRLISTGKDAGGEDMNLSVQLDALVAGSKIADAMGKVSEADFSSGLTEDNIALLRTTLAELDAIKGDMTPEAQEALNRMLHEAEDAFGTDLPVDISKIDFAQVNFTKEGALLDDVYEYQNTGAVSDVDGMIQALSESTLVLPVLAGSDVSVELPAERKLAVSEAIDGLDGADAETVADLKAVFRVDD